MPDTEEELSRGIFYQALLVGLAGQWLATPDLAPRGRDFLRGLELVGGSVLKPRGAAADGPQWHGHTG